MNREEKNAKARAKWAAGRESGAEWFIKKKAWKKARDKQTLPERRAQKASADKAWRIRNQAHHRLKSKQWKLRNPERHKEHVKKATLKYNRLHPEKNRAHVNGYRAKKLNAESDVSGVRILMELYTILGRANCFYCGKDISGKIVWDHVVPLSRGGTHTPDNLVETCRACNSSKSDKLKHEWFAWLEAKKKPA
jgi:5-methylcytosine-specific restriction endonuclease McrA